LVARNVSAAHGAIASLIVPNSAAAFWPHMGRAPPA